MTFSYSALLLVHGSDHAISTLLSAIFVVFKCVVNMVCLYKCVNIGCPIFVKMAKICFIFIFLIVSLYPQL